MSGWAGQDGHERREVIRALILRPLLQRRGRSGRLVDQARRHEGELRAWFAQELGWRLLVERDRVRLLKVPEDPGRFPDRSTPTPRQCALYCLVLAVLADCGQQTVISELADRVTALTTAHTTVRRFDATVTRERRDLVAAIRHLVESGVLTPTREAVATADDEQAYVVGTGNALYDVDHRAAAFMVACPVPPSGVDGPEHLLRVADDTAAHSELTETELRQALMRRLVDHPVVYAEDLPLRQRDYLVRHQDELVAAVRLGLDSRVEVRAEGIAVIDAQMSDMDFPGVSRASFAALALADLLAHEVTAGRGAWREVDGERLAELASAVAVRVRRTVTKIDGKPVDAAVVLGAALPVLTQLGLVDPCGDGIRVRPAITRYRDPSGRGVRSSGEALLLFGAEPDAP
ncbi:TIGR02678 family protein [Kitasatospora sp. NPDC059795]|uniref:TIGR02678 family protein n=1 Tax=Kitasatospora sp. NPDC059795 TaxID=3346949 RepID=UPI003647687D